MSELSQDQLAALFLQEVARDQAAWFAKSQEIVRRAGADWWRSRGPTPASPDKSA